MQPGHYRSIAELPRDIAVFPLPGAMLFPRWQLPLNIFEPRYLNMVDDAMQSTRLIGMVQSVGGSRVRPDIASVGCVGRITEFTETEDGRYLILLSGVCRFSVEAELDVTTPYRQVRADWSPYAADLDLCAPETEPDRTRLISALRVYALENQMNIDWNSAENAPIEALVNALCASCPFTVMEKQALLEAPGLIDRAETLITLLKMDMSGPDAGTLQ